MNEWLNATRHSSSRWLSFGRNEQDSLVYEVQGESFQISLSSTLFTGAGFHQVSHLMGTKGSFLGAKRPKRDVDHLPPSGAEVKNEYCCNSSPPVCLHRVGRVNFTLFVTNCVLIYVHGSSPLLGWIYKHALRLRCISEELSVNQKHFHQK
jgi:hypothetical protein